MKILVVDDDKVMQKAIESKLKQMGYQIMMAEDGFQALNMVQRHKIDLVISDIMMPNINGLELLNLLKGFYFNNVPVILISSMDKAKMFVGKVGWGEIDFFMKPLDFNLLIKKIECYSK